ncbi:Uncharacterised protein [Vibrio cholerae]|nr:Uncharacterised protein [Vibrio cholerae]
MNALKTAYFHAGFLPEYDSIVLVGSTKPA